MEGKYRVGGMACGGCVASVERAISALAGVKSVKVDLATGIATVAGDVSAEAVASAIENAGFDYLGKEN